jgi:hypothetical protein
LAAAQAAPERVPAAQVAVLAAVVVAAVNA